MTPHVLSYNHGKIWVQYLKCCSVVNINIRVNQHVIEHKGKKIVCVLMVAFKRYFSLQASNECVKKQNNLKNP